VKGRLRLRPNELIGLKSHKINVYPGAKSDAIRVAREPAPFDREEQSTNRSPRRPLGAVYLISRRGLTTEAFIQIIAVT
jgi:hypothetical protein